MSLYTSIYLSKRQFSKTEIHKINSATNRADWNWEGNFTGSGAFWFAQLRNIERGRGGGIEGLAELIRNTIDFKPYIPTKMQIFSCNANHMGQKPELNIHEFDWRH